MTDKKSLALIAARSKGRCEVCGRYIWGEYDPHHRKLRSRLGSDEASNLLHVCHICHMAVHANPAWASKKGFMVPSWAVPAEVPFLSWRGWVKLHDDGTQEWITTLAEF